MKIGLLFGTFDPIHVGHISIAQSIISRQIVDVIQFVITPTSPDKIKKKITSKSNSTRRTGRVANSHHIRCICVWSRSTRDFYSYVVRYDISHSIFGPRDPYILYLERDHLCPSYNGIYVVE